MQLRSELPGQHIRRRGGHALVLGLQVRQVGLRADVALGVKMVHQVIVADQAGSWCCRPLAGLEFVEKVITSAMVALLSCPG